jgi:beta-lactamase superfamily II metal-dependent hydrolase
MVGASIYNFPDANITMDTTQQGLEIDFLPVGNGEKGGDAITVRFGDLYGTPDEQTVIVIDGGYKDTGDALVEHIQNRYHTNQIDLVVSTHPDSDHSGGLEVVLDRLMVKHLWMHKPWEHTEDISRMFVDGRVTDARVREKLRTSLETVRRLENLAVRKNIPITEPFAGTHAFNQLLVVGPTPEFYESILPGFRSLPDAKQDLGILSRLTRRVTEEAQKFAEYWDFETLDFAGETSAENETSTILLLAIGDQFMLFTADAGQRALSEAVAFCESNGLDFSKIQFIQVPHHGSQRNVNPHLLNTLLGPKLTQEQNTASKTAFVSAPPEGEPKHPSKRVMNAFRRRGAPVHSTQGIAKCHFINAPWREDYSPSVALPFFSSFEE